MTESQDSICAWAKKTFGSAKLGLITARCNEEMAELITAVQAESVSTEALAAVAEECADVYIVLCQIVDHLGMDLQECVNIKMEANRNRTWLARGDGTGQHL